MSRSRKAAPGFGENYLKAKKKASRRFRKECSNKNLEGKAELSSARSSHKRHTNRYDIADYKGVDFTPKVDEFHPRVVHKLYNK